MNKKLLLSVSLISFYSACVTSLFAKTEPLISVKGQESSPMDLLESNFKTLEDIKENVKNELIEVLLGKLLEYQKHDKKKKKKHQVTQTRDSSSGFIKSEGSTQRILEITAPHAAPLAIEMGTPMPAATSEAERPMRYTKEESPELRSTQSPIQREQLSPESIASLPHAMPTTHISPASSGEKERPPPQSILLG